MDRDDEGRFSTEYEDDNFISAVRDLNVASTQNVSDRVGCSYDLAYRRLHDLEDEEKIGREEVGGSFVWTIE